MEFIQLVYTSLKTLCELVNLILFSRPLSNLSIEVQQALNVPLGIHTNALC